MPGEAGLLMCTFPKGGEKEARRGKSGHTFAGYFNECMNGFEYQVAGHMIAEGLVQEGLAVTRSVHDRYHPSQRNPYNEIECSDHYACSMASYGVFISLCGFEHHGPKGKLAFAPKMQQDYFKAAFTTAQGWGQFSQKVEGAKQANVIKIHYGHLNLNELKLESAPGTQAGVAALTLNDEKILFQETSSDKRTVYSFPKTLRLSKGDTLTIKQS